MFVFTVNKFFLFNTPFVCKWVFIKALNFFITDVGVRLGLLERLTLKSP